MFWNVASARYEISLRKQFGGIAQLPTLGRASIAKNALRWQQCFFFTRVSSPSINQGGQTCSMQQPFAENQKKQRAAKTVCMSTKMRE